MTEQKKFNTTITAFRATKQGNFMSVRHKNANGEFNQGLTEKQVEEIKAAVEELKAGDVLFLKRGKRDDQFTDNYFLEIANLSNFNTYSDNSGL